MEELPSQIRDNKGHCEMVKDETSEDVNWQVQTVPQHPNPSEELSHQQKPLASPDSW